jgi:hypothetical protein
MKDRIVERWRSIWWCRPVLTTNSRIMGRICDATVAGLERGLRDGQPKRTTSTGVTLRSMPGGVA